MSEVQLIIIAAGVVAALVARRVLLSQFSRQARAEFLEWLELGNHRG